MTKQLETTQGFTPGHTVKCVDWSYPTSPNADKFGFKNGCWTVSMGAKFEPLKAVAAFATRDEAIQHAELLPCCWSFAFLACNPAFK